ncbi:hypothetical protein AX14_006488 [Amanita brunnescens Koide BX004]|nr:hypothetical protein AX14_006488 [Amanita brunnescens Koide BX004]
MFCCKAQRSSFWSLLDEPAWTTRIRGKRTHRPRVKTLVPRFLGTTESNVCPLSINASVISLSHLWHTPRPPPATPSPQTRLQKKDQSRTGADGCNVPDGLLKLVSIVAMRCHGNFKASWSSIFSARSIMLISYYALLIFALTSSVVAPSSQKASGSAWQTLQGNTDPRLRDVEDPNGVVYRWYQLQEDKPTWPEDAKLDRFMEFIPVDGRVERVACFKFQRITTPDQLKIHVRRTGYDSVRRNSVNDPLIALAGYWGRAKGLNNLPEGYGWPSSTL